MHVIVWIAIAALALCLLRLLQKRINPRDDQTEPSRVLIAAVFLAIAALLAVNTLLIPDKNEQTATKQSEAKTPTAGSSSAKKKSAVKPGSQPQRVDVAAIQKAAARRVRQKDKQRIARIQHRRDAKERRLRKRLMRVGRVSGRVRSKKDFWKRLAQGRKARLITRHLLPAPAPAAAINPSENQSMAPAPRSSTPAPQQSAPTYVRPAPAPRAYAPTPAPKPRRKPGFQYGGLGGAPAPASKGGGTSYYDSG
jgi:hypothetical protein